MDLQRSLYFGDNLDVLRRHVKDESVDLVYLDPPFNSARDYNVLFDAQDGTRSAAQIKAFEDTWRWDESAVAAYKELVASSGQIALTMEAFRTMVGESDLLAYLSMMAPRLIELHRVLKPEGTIYLHCDPTAGHYLKLLMDGIFGGGNFLNEIIWQYQTSSGAPKKTLIRNHDLIFRYSKGSPSKVKWNQPLEPWPEKTLKKWQTDEDGRIYRVQNKFGKRYYINPEGKLMDDVWNITLSSRSKERLGYPTQKPLALLERIVAASSDPGDVVLDPFCGCGTAVDAAERLNRSWIGIDITHLAVAAIKRRLTETYPGIAFDVYGEPTTVDGAVALAESDPYGFQLWSLGLVGARPDQIKKGADKGIDGRLLFFDGDASNKAKQLIISVKGGKVQAAHIRDLRGVIEREGVAGGVLIAAHGFTRQMYTEAASAGTWRSEWTGAEYPRLQLVTIEDLLNGTELDYPHITGADRTQRTAQPFTPENTAPADTLFD